jgi:hypothetical protein
LAVLNDDIGVDAATDHEFRAQLHVAGLAGRHQVGQDPVGDRLVERALMRMV